MIWTLIPHSQARTSWDLLRDVRQAILDEPKRLNFNVWCGLRPQALGLDTRPACDTVACVAGWMVIMVAESEEYLCHPPADIVRRFGSVAQQALSYLPVICREDAYRLFCGFEPYAWPGGIMAKAGTPAHARQAIKYLDAFMRQWEMDLIAHVIRPEAVEAAVTEPESDYSLV